MTRSHQPSFCGETKDAGPSKSSSREIRARDREGQDDDAAMAAAGYSDPRNSTRLMKNDEIHRRIDELKERGAARAEVSVASLLDELEEARQLALKFGQASAAAQCSMGKAKITGHIIDRREVGDVGAFDHMTDEELVSAAARKARELGIAGPREVEDDNKKPR